VHEVSKVVIYETQRKVESIFAREERLDADKEGVWEAVGRGFSEKVTSTAVEKLTRELDLEATNCMTDVEREGTVRGIRVDSGVVFRVFDESWQ